MSSGRAWAVLDEAPIGLNGKSDVMLSTDHAEMRPSELQKAIHVKSYILVKYFLDNVDMDEDRRVIKKAIEFLARQPGVSAVKKVYLISEIREKFSSNCVREFTFSIVSSIIEFAISTNDVHQFILKLDQIEDAHPCLRHCESPTDTFADHQWNGKTVSQDWARLIEQSKRKIKEFADKELGYAPPIIAFLATPTYRKRSFVFPEMNSSSNLLQPLLNESKTEKSACCCVIM